MSTCSFEDFKKIELTIGKIVEADRVENSEKLLKLQVDLGEKDESGEITHRQIIAGIGKIYSPEALIGSEVVVVSNLEPKSLMGLESRGMLLAASQGEQIVLLRPDNEIPPGAHIR